MKKNENNKSFGILFFIVFLILGMWPLTKGNAINIYLVFLAIVFLILGLLNSKLLSPHQVTHLVDTDNPSQLQEDLTKNNNAVNRKRKESTVGPDALLTWLAKQVEAYERVVISDMTTSFQSGLALCAIIHR